MTKLQKWVGWCLLPLALGCGMPDVDAPGAELETRKDELEVFFLANACGNSGTAPQIFSNTIMSPQALPPGGAAPQNWNPSNGRITRGNIEYVSGNGLRFELVTDNCTFIKEVRVGSQVLPTSYANGYWYSAQPSTNPPADPNRTGYNLWAFFPYQPDGSTDTVSITVGRVGGTGTATHSFPMVRVDEVEASSVRAPVGFSEAELMNIFAKALFAKFNGAQNSAVITSTDGSTRRIYGYDPSSLSVNVDASSGVSFSFKFKTDINNWCDPTVRAHGNFNLKADANGISVDWINRAQGSLQWPLRCNAVQVVPILGLIPNIIYGVIEDRAGNSVVGTVEKAVVDALPDVGPASLFLDGSSTSRYLLNVYLKLSAPSVMVRVPYDPFSLPRSATAFPSGETVGLLATGLGVNDEVAGVTPRTLLWSGPNGVPRFGTTTVPRVQTLNRTASAMVWSDAPVGRLLARRTDPLISSTTTFQYKPGCTVTAWSRFGNASLQFGVNDTVADANRLRAITLAAPGYSTRLMFLNELGSQIANAVPPCEAKPSLPVIVGTLSP
ncbi:MAG: hypothetical protein WBV82_26850 [Myxococcaceae bacterium]